MDILIHPKKLSGKIRVIPSKSMVHRLLICSAFANGPTKLICPDSNQDIDATAECLRALGANIQRTKDGYHILPFQKIPDRAALNCRESGSTLRFMLPIVGALGIRATIQMEGRLPQRPLSPLWEEMERMGCKLSRPTEATISCEGRLKPGIYTIAGNVSSQFITGLLFAFSLMEEPCFLDITGRVESAPYIQMTQAVLNMFPHHQTPGIVEVEGDWSNGAFFLAASAMGCSVVVENLESRSVQGDRAVADWLQELNKKCLIPAQDIPDLVPILAVVAACKKGAVFTDIQRLRLKESDRVASVIAMVEALGGKAEATESTLTVFGTGLIGGTVCCFNDHRIAMAAAIAATVCKEPVILLGAECVQKSYPRFFEEYSRLGGNYEQYLR